MSHSFPFCYSTLGFFFLPLFTSFLSLILFSCACLTRLGECLKDTAAGLIHPLTSLTQANSQNEGKLPSVG